MGTEDETLDRYTIEGLIWGRETLWFDAHKNLVAAVTTTPNSTTSKPFATATKAPSAISSGAPAPTAWALWPKFEGIPGSHEATLAIVGATLIDGTGRPADSRCRRRDP